MADPGGWSAGSAQLPPEHSGPPRRHLALVGLIALLAVALVGGLIVLLGNRTPSRIEGAVAASEEAKEGPDKPAPPPRKRKPRDDSKVIGRPTNLSAMARQVSQVRQIPLERPVRSRRVSADALATKISELAFSEQDPQEVADTQRLLVALRLAQPDIDLAKVVEDLYREQVLGVYVAEERTLYVAGEGELSPGQRSTTAHEITHALQDQAFGLAKLQKRYEDRADAALAVLSLVEGDAVLTQQLWEQENLTAAERQQAALEAGGGSSEALARAPEYLRAGLFFPYTRGSYFVATLYRDGGFAAVDEAFSNPPTTSEQILHPERYLERDDPVAAPVKSRPGAGWKRSTKYEFGEFDVRELFGVVGNGPATAAGEGWDGGEIRSWSNGPDTAVAAVLAFDTPQDATEVCEILPQWYTEVAEGRRTDDGLYAGDRDHLAVDCRDDAVAFALAPSPQTARRLVASP